jgi:hypothetical protein
MKKLLLAFPLLLLSQFAIAEEEVYSSARSCEERKLTVTVKHDQVVATDVTLYGCSSEGSFELTSGLGKVNGFIGRKVFFSFQKNNIISYEIEDSKPNIQTMNIRTGGYLHYVPNKSYTIFDNKRTAYIIKVD